MKKAILLIILTLAPNLFAQRYLTKVFGSYTKQSGITYCTIYNPAKGSNENLKFDLYQPSNDSEQNRIPIVFMHGGGFHSGSRSEMDSSCKDSARRGYVAFTIDYRLDPSVSPEDSMGTYLAGQRAVADLGSFIRFIKARKTTYRIDTTRIVIHGFSAGAIMVNMYNYMAFDDVPMFNQNTTNPGYSNKIWMGSEQSGSTTAPYVDPGEPPLLIQHGTSDEKIPVADAYSMDAALTAAGIDHEMIIYQGGGHVLSKTTVATRLAEFIYERIQAPPCPLVANFSGAPLSGCAPLNVSFSDLSTGGATSWAWNFGDGGTSTQQNPAHAYQTAGSFSVTLTVSNGSCNHTFIKSQYVNVSAAPVAQFSASPLSGNAPLTVNFINQSAGASSYLWDFGDGNTSTAASPSHAYQAEGTYTVSLTATNTCGSNVEIKANYIAVSPCLAPAAAFSASPLNGNVPLTVNFMNQSTNASSYSWDFGDGGTSTVANPQHTYQAPGSYSVSLLVSNACGSDSEAKANYIIVNEPPPPPSCSYTNFSLSATASASASHGGTSPANARDGNTSTVWGAYLSASQWLEMNLGSPKNVDSAVVKWANPYFAKAYCLQYWSGSAWVNIQCLSSQTTGGVKTFKFPAINAQRFRLSMTQLNSTGYAVQEFEVWGCVPAKVGILNEGLQKKESGLQIYPNPANPDFALEYNLAAAQLVEISILNLAGQIVRQESGLRNGGRNREHFDLAGEPSGIYFATVRTPAKSFKSKFTLLK